MASLPVRSTDPESKSHKLCGCWEEATTLTLCLGSPRSRVQGPAKEVPTGSAGPPSATRAAARGRVQQVPSPNKDRNEHPPKRNGGAVSTKRRKLSRVLITQILREACKQSPKNCGCLQHHISAGASLLCSSVHCNQVNWKPALSPAWRPESGESTRSAFPKTSTLETINDPGVTWAPRNLLRLESWGARRGSNGI